MWLSMDPYSSMQLATAAERSDASTDRSNNDTVDFVQSLNTTLCFLCWVNVDATVVEAFLKKHPEAMLLEGMSQDSAYRIVLERQKKCKCHETSACNNNRKKLLAILEEGFGHYQDIHMQALLRGQTTSSALPNLKSLLLFPRMMTVGRHLRSLQIKESAV